MAVVRAGTGWEPEVMVHMQDWAEEYPAVAAEFAAELPERAAGVGVASVVVLSRQFTRKAGGVSHSHR